MESPVVNPEPVAYRIRGGSVPLGPESRLEADDFVAGLDPDPRVCIREALGVRGETIQDGPPRIMLRRLTSEDLAVFSRFFRTDLPEECIRSGAYSLRAAEAQVEVASTTAEGFRCAAQTLRQLCLREGDELRLRNSVVYDYPSAALRAAGLSTLRGCDMGALARLLGMLAALKYNALLVPDGDLDVLPPAERTELERLCLAQSIRLLSDSRAPRGLIDDLDGPSVLDWEHRSRAEGFSGAVVRHRGELTEANMAQSGFLFNLVYSSYPLWRSDYTNFSWEKVVDLALERMPWFLGLLDGMAVEEPRGPGVDRYPVPLHPGSRAVASGEDLSALARIGDSAEAIVFRHSIIGGPSSGDGTGHRAPVGRYTVRYRDGRSRQIDLIPGLNIGPDSAWCGRRYDPWRRRFETDRSLAVLCCYSRPVKSIRGDGLPALAYDFVWMVDTPTAPIETIDVAITDLSAPWVVRIESIHVVRRGVTPGGIGAG